MGSKGTSVIDYAWVNHEAMKWAIDFSVLNLGTSDHLPVAINLEHTASDGRQVTHTSRTTERSVKIKWDKKRTSTRVLRKSIAETNTVL